MHQATLAFGSDNSKTRVSGCIHTVHYGKMEGIGKVQVWRSNDIYQKNPFLKSKLFYKRHFIFKLELFLQI